MSDFNISISFDADIDIPQKKTWFKNIIRRILKLMDINSPIEIGLFITDDKKIKALNKKHRKIDKPTDVLSFQMDENKGSEKFILPPDDINRMGEIIISIETAKRDAAKQKLTIEEELTFLLVHGVLHLAGYDHIIAEEGRVMRNKEDEVISLLEAD